MSPYGDLVEFGYILAGPILVMALAYLWGRYIAFREQRRHNLAVERHNYRIWQQIKRLGDCDGADAVKVDPPTFRPGGLDSPPRRQSSADLCRGRS